MTPPTSATPEFLAAVHEIAQDSKAAALKMIDLETRLRAAEAALSRERYQTESVNIPALRAANARCESLQTRVAELENRVEQEINLGARNVARVVEGLVKSDATIATLTQQLAEAQRDAARLKSGGN